jgi:hypothetical protein
MVGLAAGVAPCYHAVMGQPVKLSDGLVADARTVCAVSERSIAGQIEYWARLGRAVDGALDGETVLQMKRRADGLSLLDTLTNRTREQRLAAVRAFMETEPFPHYEGVPGKKPLLVRIEADGTRTVGKFVNQVFRAIKKR